MTLLHRPVAALVLILATFIFGTITCDRPEDPYAPVYARYPEFPIRMVDIDFALTTLTDSDYESYPFSSESFGTEHVILTDRTVYTVDKTVRTVRQHDPATFEVLREFNRIGRGPGEYQEIGGVSVSDGLISVLDRMQAKIITYDQDFNYLSEETVSGIYLGSETFVRTRDLLYFHIQSESEHLVGIAHIRDSTRTSFHNSVIPIGFQPGLYNKSIMSLHDRELMLVSTGMPIAFIYGLEDDRPRPKALLRFRSPSLEMVGKPMTFDAGFGSSQVSNPPPIKVEKDNRVYAMNSVFRRAIRTDTHILLEDIPNQSLMLIRSGRSRYDYAGNVMFSDSSGGRLVDSDFQVRDGHLLIGLYDENRLIRVPLATLGK